MIKEKDLLKFLEENSDLENVEITEFSYNGKNYGNIEVVGEREIQSFEKESIRKMIKDQMKKVNNQALDRDELDYLLRTSDYDVISIDELPEVSIVSISDKLNVPLEQAEDLVQSLNFSLRLDKLLDLSEELTYELEEELQEEENY